MSSSAHGSSYTKINYRLRPAKCIERKMMVEVFRHLAPFGQLTSYKYIGFGSTYFSDFTLLHRALGITQMISIEHDVDNADRFNFNRPFRCIEMKFGSSSTVLPQLDWTSKAIVWLDYDGALTQLVLDDIRTVIGAALSGTVLIISVNAHPPNRPDSVSPDKLDEWRLEDLTVKVGESNIPQGLTGKDLRQWGTAVVSRRIIHTCIKTTLHERNGGQPPNDKFDFCPVINFHYADGAKMMTFGGILYETGQRETLDACRFHDLKFACRDEACLISVPNLTLREIRHLDSLLPKGDESVLLNGVPQKDIDAYSEFYRFFPNFTESDM